MILVIFALVFAAANAAVPLATEIIYSPGHGLAGTPIYSANGNEIIDVESGKYTYLKLDHSILSSTISNTDNGRERELSFGFILSGDQHNVIEQDWIGRNPGDTLPDYGIGYCIMSALPSDTANPGCDFGERNVSIRQMSPDTPTFIFIAIEYSVLTGVWADYNMNGAWIAMTVVTSVDHYDLLSIGIMNDVEDPSLHRLSATYRISNSFTYDFSSETGPGNPASLSLITETSTTMSMGYSSPEVTETTLIFQASYGMVPVSTTGMHITATLTKQFPLASSAGHKVQYIVQIFEANLPKPGPSDQITYNALKAGGIFKCMHPLTKYCTGSCLNSVVARSQNCDLAVPTFSGISDFSPLSIDVTVPWIVGSPVWVAVTIVKMSPDSNWPFIEFTVDLDSINVEYLIRKEPALNILNAFYIDYGVTLSSNVEFEDINDTGLYSERQKAVGIDGEGSMLANWLSFSVEHTPAGVDYWYIYTKIDLPDEVDYYSYMEVKFYAIAPPAGGTAINLRVFTPTSCASVSQPTNNLQTYGLWTQDPTGISTISSPHDNYGTSPGIFSCTLDPLPKYRVGSSTTLTDPGGVTASHHGDVAVINIDSQESIWLVFEFQASDGPVSLKLDNNVPTMVPKLYLFTATSNLVQVGIEEEQFPVTIDPFVQGDDLKMYFTPVFLDGDPDDGIYDVQMHCTSIPAGTIITTNAVVDDRIIDQSVIGGNEEEEYLQAYFDRIEEADDDSGSSDPFGVTSEARVSGSSYFVYPQNANDGIVKIKIVTHPGMTWANMGPLFIRSSEELDGCQILYNTMEKRENYIYHALSGGSTQLINDGDYTFSPGDTLVVKTDDDFQDTRGASDTRILWDMVRVSFDILAPFPPTEGASQSEVIIVVLSQFYHSPPADCDNYDCERMITIDLREDDLVPQLVSNKQKYMVRNLIFLRDKQHHQIAQEYDFKYLHIKYSSGQFDLELFQDSVNYARRSKSTHEPETVGYVSVADQDAKTRVPATFKSGTPFIFTFTVQDGQSVQGASVNLQILSRDIGVTYSFGYLIYKGPDVYDSSTGESVHYTSSYKEWGTIAIPIGEFEPGTYEFRLTALVSETFYIRLASSPVTGTSVQITTSTTTESTSTTASTSSSTQITTASSTTTESTSTTVPTPSSTQITTASSTASTTLTESRVYSTQAINSESTPKKEILQNGYITAIVCSVAVVGFAVASVIFRLHAIRAPYIKIGAD